MTGLRKKCSLGRPDWRSLLSDIKQNSGLEVTFKRILEENYLQFQTTLFYCGASGVSDILHPVCDDLGISFRSEIF